MSSISHGNAHRHHLRLYTQNTQIPLLCALHMCAHTYTRAHAHAQRQSYFRENALIITRLLGAASQTTTLKHTDWVPNLHAHTNTNADTHTHTQTRKHASARKHTSMARQIHNSTFNRLLVCISFLLGLLAASQRFSSNCCCIPGPRRSLFSCAICRGLAPSCSFR